VRVGERRGLVPVDLPVDANVVLEQEERAHERERGKRALSG
jgi:hypothetical protein